MRPISRTIACRSAAMTKEPNARSLTTQDFTPTPSSVMSPFTTASAACARTAIAVGPRRRLAIGHRVHGFPQVQKVERRQMTDNPWLIALVFEPGIVPEEQGRLGAPRRRLLQLVV